MSDEKGNHTYSISETKDDASLKLELKVTGMTDEQFAALLTNVMRAVHLSTTPPSKRGVSNFND
jgi:hypothetical protein